MRIINRGEFLKMPAGTVFCKYTPVVFGELNVKECNPNDGWVNDFICSPLTGAVDFGGTSSSDDFDGLFRCQETGESFHLDLECSCRDGLYEDDQLFAIYEQHDLIQLIERLRGFIILQTK
jgi:hypothetical protein